MRRAIARSRPATGDGSEPSVEPLVCLGSFRARVNVPSRDVQCAISTFRRRDRRKRTAAREESSRCRSSRDFDPEPHSVAVWKTGTVPASDFFFFFFFSNTEYGYVRARSRRRPQPAGRKSAATPIRLKRLSRLIYRSLCVVKSSVRDAHANMFVAVLLGESHALPSLYAPRALVNNSNVRESPCVSGFAVSRRNSLRVYSCRDKSAPFSRSSVSLSILH